MTTEKTLFNNPFSKKYWYTAAMELCSIRSLCIAAVLIALRIALKVVDIPLGVGISIGVGFLVNSVLGAVCGPVIALIAGAITDSLGYLVDPQGGPYLFLFMFVEMLGSFIYALFLYKTKITFGKLLLCKASVNLFVNIILQNILLYVYNYIGKAIFVTITTSVVKNVILLPVEVMMLTVFLGALIPPLKKMKILPAEQEQLKISYVTIAIMAVCVVAIVILAINYFDFKAIKAFIKSILS